MILIGFSGRSQSGKTRLCNWLTGLWLQKIGLVEYSFCDDDGDLVVPVTLDGKLEDKVIHYSRESLWLKENAYSTVKQFSFADKLKQFCMDVFSCEYDQMYGTNTQKDTLTKVQWKGFPKSVQKIFGKRPEVYLSARELLQAFGTEVVRKIYNNSWTEACLKKVQEDSPELALISDVRFPNEVQAILDVGGIVIRLTRDPLHSSHDSEVALDSDNFDQTKFSVILDNSNLDRSQQNKVLYELLKDCGVIDFEIEEWVSPKELKEKKRVISEGVMRIK